MKRRLRNEVLAAALVAACVSCSRSSHLYSIGEVGNTYDHHWTAFQGSCGIIQCGVPYDASGQEVRHKGQKIVRWRTYTDVFILGHCFEFHGPAWLAGLLVTSLAAAAVGAIAYASGHMPEKFSGEKHKA